MVKQVKRHSVMGNQMYVLDTLTSSDNLLYSSYRESSNKGPSPFQGKKVTVQLLQPGPLRQS